MRDRPCQSAMRLVTLPLTVSDFRFRGCLAELRKDARGRPPEVAPTHRVLDRSSITTLALREMAAINSRKKKPEVRGAQPEVRDKEITSSRKKPKVHGTEPEVRDEEIISSTKFGHEVVKS